MVKHGARPNKIDHRDWDFVKSFGAVRAVQFPPEYNTDAGLTMPDQEVENDYFNPPVPALPFGCTDYATSEVATDLDHTFGADNPMKVENITQANARGGFDIRQSLLVGVQLGFFTGIFNIRSIGQDYFDAIRDAMASGATERRSVSIGTPWYAEFEGVGLGNGKMTSSGIISAPASWNTAGLPWHNWKICGWKKIGDQPYLVGKSWQGTGYADKGLCYFSRSIINQLMSIQGTVAFTATRGVLPPISTITTTWLQWLLSNARNLLGY